LAQSKIKAISVGMLSVLIMASVVGVSFLSQHAEASPGDEVTLRLKWLHQAQFAGFYTAEQKGFYENKLQRKNSKQCQLKQ